VFSGLRSHADANLAFARYAAGEDEGPEIGAGAATSSSSTKAAAVTTILNSSLLLSNSSQRRRARSSSSNSFTNWVHRQTSFSPVSRNVPGR
jgi:hypothetical protein